MTKELKMNFHRFLVVAYPVLLVLLHSCATEPNHAYYVNEMGEVSVSDSDLSSELQLVVRAMTNVMMPTVRSGSNMLHSSQWPTKVKPLVVIVEFDNHTEEFVDSQLVTNVIRATLQAQGGLKVLDDELPLAKVHWFAPSVEDKSLDWDPSLVYVPQMTPGEASLVQQFKGTPFQPAPVRVSELLPSGRLSPEKKKQDLFVDNRVLPATSPEQDAPLHPHKVGEPAPVRMSIMVSSPDGVKSFESRSQKKERLLSFLEKTLKEQREGVQGYAPIYVIKTVLLPFATRPSDIDGGKEPYMFKMFVEDFRSGTLKWVSAWEVRKTSSVSSIVDNQTGSSYRATTTTEPEQNAKQGTTLMDDVRDVRDITGTAQNIRAIREAAQN